MTTEAVPSIARYEAVPMPRGNVVYEMPSRRVEADFPSMEEATTHADQLNKWLAGRPSPDRRYRIWAVPAEPTEAELFALIDRLHEPEAALEKFAVELGRQAAELIEDHARPAAGHPPLALVEGVPGLEWEDAAVELANRGSGT